MPRQTREQLEAEIVDRAAALFARQGFAGTSLQQIADAVGYSKAGLLHHYPSKDAIYLAAQTVTRDLVADLADRAEAAPAGFDRDRLVVESSVDLTYRWPGVAQFVGRLAEQEDLDDAALLEAAARLAAAFTGDDPDEDRVVRAVLVSTGVTESAVAAVRAGLQREWRELIIRSAMDALGHADRSAS